MDVFLTILGIVWPYALPFVTGFTLGWLSRWTKIDHLTADLARARAEAAGDKIREPRRSPGAGRRRTALPDVSTAGVSYVPADARGHFARSAGLVEGGQFVESRYQGGQEASHDTQPIPTTDG
jgi:hypothetical protein